MQKFQFVWEILSAVYRNTLKVDQGHGSITGSADEYVHSLDITLKI